MATSLAAAQEHMRDLSVKALKFVEDPNLTIAEKKTYLDDIEPKIADASAEVKAWESVAGAATNFRKALGHDLGEMTPEELGSKANREELRALKSYELGDQFVASQEFKGLGKVSGKTGRWSTGGVELKTAVTEGTIASPGPVGALVQNPNVIPGITGLLFQQLTVEDLIPSGTTDSPLLRYMVEVAVTNAAATVAELGLKPESAISFSKVDETLRKIATFLPISDETLEDWQQAASYLNARLALFVRQATEVQLLRGDGTGQNLVGVLNRVGLAPNVVKGNATPPGGSATGAYLSPTTDNDMDAIYRQITQVRLTSFLEPETIVIDPAAWMNIQLSKNTQGTYYAGGPFMGVGSTPNLWGKPVVPTTAMPASTALVACFRQASQVFSKGGLTVEASNSHADFFQRNETAIRAERRLLLAVYRPGAFGTVTGL